MMTAEEDRLIQLKNNKIKQTKQQHKNHLSSPIHSNYVIAHSEAGQ